MCETKKCSKCGITKSLSEFYKDKNTKSGYRSHCKACIKKHYEKNKDKIAARKKKWYEENKEKIVAQVKKYYKENKEKRAAYLEKNKEKRAAYLEKNKDKIAARKKKWYEENKEKLAAYYKKRNQTPQGKFVSRKADRKRRALKAGVNEIPLTQAQIDFIYKQHNGCCFDCGMTEEENGKTLTKDHFYALSLGYPLHMGNVILQCVSCSSKKGSKLPEDYYSEEEFERHQQALNEQIEYENQSHKNSELLQRQEN